jgi:hypothetical protein
MLKTILSLFFLTMLLISCEEKTGEMNTAEQIGNLAGSTWRLYEHGYSPGSGYVTEPVAEHPSQQITFIDDRSVNITVEGLEQYRYYRIVSDSTQGKIFALFQTEMELNSSEPFRHSYNMQLTDRNLKLSFRYCIEGCHMAFKLVMPTGTRN